MPHSSVIQFVSAGLFQPKKRDHALARRQLYLNYGALTLASQLQLHGFDVSLWHGEHDDPCQFAQRLLTLGRLPSSWPLMVSIQSFYALPWTQAFCREVKRLDPASRIVLGGRWVTGPDPVWLRSLIPDADLVVSGLGEAIIWDILGVEAPTGAAHIGALPPFGLRHSLVENFRRFQPSIEVSRGCGMGCAFCEERDISLSRLRTPKHLTELFLEASAEYSEDEIHPYLQSSFFLPNPRWAAELQREIEEGGRPLSWRCETRVDGFKPETIAALAAAGLKVIDLGLESASLKQLQMMRKARDPQKYLSAGSRLLDACAANGVWVKANVLLYAGETAKTLAETQAWLDQHAAAIKGVSVGPVVAFGPPAVAGPFLSSLAEFGAKPVDPKSAAKNGLTQLHLSPDFNVVNAERVSIELSRRYMTADDYFDLKAFSYYPRDYSRADFDRDVDVSEVNSLPFRQATNTPNAAVPMF